MEITKEFTFDSAHQLPGHKGKCSRLHGHTYRLIVAVEGEPVSDRDSSDDGMVMDFGDLKEIVKEHVVDRLDHRFISSGDEPIVRDLRTFDEENRLFGKDGIFLLGRRTTVENIAQWIFDVLVLYIPNLAYVTLYETPTSSVTIRRK